MPQGKPNAQTMASARYQKKMGYVSKSFKLKEEDVKAFKIACEAAGVSMASQITAMMRQFVADVNGQEAGKGA